MPDNIYLSYDNVEINIDTAKSLMDEGSKPILVMDGIKFTLDSVKQIDDSNFEITLFPSPLPRWEIVRD